MEIKTEHYLVPTWSLPALIYDDYSGFEDHEKILIDNFFARLDREMGDDPKMFEVNGEEYFSHKNDIHDLGDECVEVIVSTCT